MSGVLTSHFGWQAPFYFYGAVGLLWYVFWLWLSFERPSKHPSIAREEVEYIEAAIGQVSSKPPTVSIDAFYARPHAIYAIQFVLHFSQWHLFAIEHTIYSARTHLI